MARKAVFRTSHWLCADPVYGINGTDTNAMPILVDKLKASEITVYFKDSDLPQWQINQLVGTIDFWKAKGLKVWLFMGKTTLDETAGTTYSVQYFIDLFKGKIEGIIIDYFNTVDPATATNWLLAKKQQLETNGMKCGYYHGDGFAPDYGNSATDVNAQNLTSQGLICVAWLQNNGSWKPTTFNLDHFWIDYDILVAESWGGPTGQSSTEILAWYNNYAKNLKTNVGCESLVFMCYMNTDYPNLDAINGMISAINDWVGGENVANVTFIGAVSAQATSGETVTIKVSQGGTIITTLTALTLTDKTYSTISTQFNAGTYTVQSSIDADAIYSAASSTTVPFTVTLSTRTLTVTVSIA